MEIPGLCLTRWNNSRKAEPLFLIGCGKDSQNAHHSLTQRANNYCSHWKCLECYSPFDMHCVHAVSGSRAKQQALFWFGGDDHFFVCVDSKTLFNLLNTFTSVSSSQVEILNICLWKACFCKITCFHIALLYVAVYGFVESSKIKF